MHLLRALIGCLRFLSPNRLGCAPPSETIRQKPCQRPDRAGPKHVLAKSLPGHNFSFRRYAIYPATVRISTRQDRVGRVSGMRCGLNTAGVHMFGALT